MREELVPHGWDVTGDSDISAAAQARLRVQGTDHVLLSADADHTTIELAEPEGQATLETDAAARVLLLWGRRPGDPSRICSRAVPEVLGRVRRLLSGY
jgi:cytochrome c1